MCEIDNCWEAAVWRKLLSSSVIWDALEGWDVGGEASGGGVHVYWELTHTAVQQKHILKQLSSTIKNKLKN